MNELQPIYNEHDLFLHCQKLRLDKDEEVLALKQVKDKKEEGGKLTFKQKTNNLLKGAKTLVKGYEKKEAKIKDNLNSFSHKNLTCPSSSEAKELVVSLFGNDPYGASKLTFAITVLLDGEYEYVYEEEGIEEVSLLLYGNKKEMKEIYSSLKDSYKDVSPKALTNVQKAALFGVALAASAGAALLPVLAVGGVGAGASVTTASLAALGFSDMQIGVGVLTAESLLFGAALVGATYSGMKLYNIEKVKKQFRKLSPEKGAMYLAIQVVYIERLKKSLKKEEFKEKLDEILKGVNTLKSDLDYYYFVEQDDLSDNKAKLKSFHNFDAKLAKVLGL